MTTLSRSDDFIHWSEPKETLRGRGYENQVYSMPVFFWNGIYLGLASIIHEGDRREENFDTVDCELTWAVNPEHFDFVAPGQNLIPRGEGHYPTGAFDCGCIYASQPVIGPDGKIWLYYMGGNGRHTNFRESSLARAFWQPDQFAAMVQKDKNSDSFLTSCRLKFGGSNLEILAQAENPDKPVLLEAQIHHIWTELPLSGFTFEESRTENTSDGWIRISWPEGMEKLKGSQGCIKFRFKNMKIWAVRGDLCLDGHRLWEGADMENEIH